MSSLSEEERQQLKSCLETLLGKTLKEFGIEDKMYFPFSQRAAPFEHGDNGGDPSEL